MHIVHQSLATNSVWEVMDHALGSDHSPTITGINVHLPDNSEYFRMSKADWKSFKNNAQELVTPDSVADSRSVAENAEYLTSAIIRAAELSIQKGKKSKNKRLKPLPYWNENCKNAIRDRNKARNAMHNVAPCLSNAPASDSSSSGFVSGRGGQRCAPG